MNAKRIALTLTVLVIVMMLGLSAVSAQGGRGRDGNGQPGNGQQNGAGQQYGQQNGANLQNRMGQQYGGGMNGTTPLHLNVPPASAEELPQGVIDLMVEGWADEQHAYALYGAVIQQFGAVRPFTNIQRSEAQHIAEWEFLFDRYGIEMPEVPTFELPEVATLAEACAIGAEAEVANADLYATMMDTFEPYADLLYTAEMLSSVSENNHKPAFELCANR